MLVNVINEKHEWFIIFGTVKLIMFIIDSEIHRSLFGHSIENLFKNKNGQDKIPKVKIKEAPPLTQW